MLRTDDGDVQDRTESIRFVAKGKLTENVVKSKARYLKLLEQIGEYIRLSILLARPFESSHALVLFNKCDAENADVLQHYTWRRSHIESRQKRQR